MTIFKVSATPTDCVLGDRLADLATMVPVDRCTASELSFCPTSTRQVLGSVSSVGTCLVVTEACLVRTNWKPACIQNMAQPTAYKRTTTNCLPNAHPSFLHSRPFQDVEIEYSFKV